jgi:Rieske Fe-S protein
MKRREDEGLILARRQVLGVGVAGAALAVLPEACSSSSNPETPDSGVDGRTADTSAGDGGEDGAADAEMEGAVDASPEPPDATLVDGSGSCVQTDYTHPVNILKEGLDSPGTAFAFTDTRYLDPACSQSQIILINPVTKTGYVAMSGSCTHECCDNEPARSGGPTYMPLCQVIADAATFSGLSCQVPDAGSSADASGDASSDATSDASADANRDASADANREASMEAGGGSSSGPPQAGQILKDVLFCTCHGSIFSAVTGEVINGPAQGSLQLLDVCVGGGYVFVTIPPVP